MNFTPFGILILVVISVKVKLIFSDVDKTPKPHRDIPFPRGRIFCRGSSVWKNRYLYASTGSQYLSKYEEHGLGLDGISEKECSKICDAEEQCSLYCWGGQLNGNQAPNSCHGAGVHTVPHNSEGECRLYKRDDSKTQKLNLHSACIKGRVINLHLKR